MGDLQRQTSALTKARLGEMGDTEKLRSQVAAAQREFDSKMSDVNEQIALAIHGCVAAEPPVPFA
jgi:hypothetical protein